MSAKALQLSDDQVRDFRDKGVLYLPRWFDAVWVDTLRRGVDRNVIEPSKEFQVRFTDKATGAQYITDSWSTAWIHEYLEFLRGSGIAEMAAKILEARKVALLEDNYFVKKAGSGVPTPWHHDNPYLEVDGPFVIAWLPLDPIELGESLRVVVGSHRWGKRFLPADFDPDQKRWGTDGVPEGYDLIPDICAHLEDYDIASWAVEPGDCILLDGLAVHGAAGNATPRDQRRFTCRFVSERAIYAPTPHKWTASPPNHLKPGDPLVADSVAFPTLWDSG